MTDKRIPALILAALILSSSLVSCGSAQPAAADTVTTAVTSADTAAAADTTAVQVKANVPEEDYEGADFLILTYDDGNLATRTYKNSDADTETGDTINDAIYKRNLTVEEDFNINISQFATGSVESVAKKAIMAGDSTYDLIISSISHIRGLASSGYLINLYDVPYIDMTREYWDQNMSSELTIGGKLFCNTGDIAVYDDMRVVCSIFNKGLWEQNGLEDPYELVLGGKWTLDKMIELGSNVTKDLNGDGVYDQNDLWGIMSEYGAGNDFFFASGERMVSLDADGNPKIVFDSERSISAAEKTLTFLLDSANVFLGDKIKSDDVWVTASLMFQQDQVLMRTTTFEPVPRDLRAMDTDFGVLPIPKFDEQQSDYHSFARSDIYVACVPSSVSSAERSGIITESLAAGSVATLTPAFYDISLQGKVLRDDASQSMLDIIFGSKVYDIGYLYSIGSFESMLSNIISSGKNNFASKLEGSLSKAQTSLDKLVDAYAEIGEN
ncbi:MAG: extracellular solute-binding protein [Eubacteriales bacterium]